MVSRSLDISPAFRDTVASSHSEALLFWRMAVGRLSRQRNLSVAKNYRVSASLLDWALDCGHCETGKDGQSEPRTREPRSAGHSFSTPATSSKPCHFLDLRLRYPSRFLSLTTFYQEAALFLRFLPYHGSRFLLIPRPQFLLLMNIWTSHNFSPAFTSALQTIMFL